MKKILVITPNDVPRGVLQSQLIGMSYYLGRAANVTIAIHKHNKSLDEIIGVKIIKFSSYNSLRKMLRFYDEIYVRGIPDYFKIICCRKFSILNVRYDFRALASFESYFRNRSYIRFLILFIAEFIAYRKAMNVQCVSYNLRDTLYKYYGKRKVSVVPCLTNKVVRRNDSVSEVIKFVYVGSLSKWQRIDYIIETAIKIQKSIASEFTFVTPGKLQLEKLLDKSSLKNYCVLSVDQLNIFEILKTQDYGFLFRHDIVVNRVSSPIKYLEYTSSGVVPILTPYIGDYSNTTIENELGIILLNGPDRLVEDIKRVNENIVDYRERLYNFSVLNTWDRYEE